MDVLEWMAQRLAGEKIEQSLLRSDDPRQGVTPVAKTFVSINLRTQTFLDMDSADKIEWLDRKIMHRMRGEDTKNTTAHAGWKKIIANTSTQGAVAVKDVINYTKQLVRSVKQLLRVMMDKAKSDFPKAPEIYSILVPYPAGDYDPLENPDKVDSVLFVESEHPHGAIIWDWLSKARKGHYDSKLIAMYGVSGVQWPVLKCDGTDLPDSYPPVIRTQITAINLKLEVEKRRVQAEEKRKKELAELARIDSLRVALTISVNLGEGMPLYISASWHRFPVPSAGKTFSWKICAPDDASEGEGSIKFDDVPLGPNSFVIYGTDSEGKINLLVNTDKSPIKVHVEPPLVESDVESGRVLDITSVCNSSNTAIDIDGDDAVGGGGEGDGDGDGEGDDEDDAPTRGGGDPDLDEDGRSDTEREKDPKFKPDDVPKKGAPTKPSTFTRTHAHPIDTETPFPIDPSNLTAAQKSMGLDKRIQFCNADAFDLLNGGSDMLIQARG